MLVPIPALNDNYIWLYRRENLPVIVVDVAETDALLRYFTQYQLVPEAVLITHYHSDHTAGIAEFIRYFPQVPVYGPSEAQAHGVTHLVESGQITTPHYQIQVLPTGGHTAGHLSFVVDGHLFCGDTLFSAGCGRVFTGDYEQMYQSLQRLKQLPESTLVCAAHEYTLSNLVFALTVMEDKSAVENQLKLVQTLRAKNQPSLPTTLGLEMKINPFLVARDIAQFVAWRKAKDNF